jgi:hypothetical protein
MSEEFFNSIPGLPKPKEGLRMRLYALTGEAKVLGYTRFLIYALSASGELISFEVEAYVVCNMRVPLLLGEDFQITYELGVTRYSNGHCDVRVGQSGYIIPGSSAQKVDLGFDLRKVHAVKAKSFLRRTAARRGRARAQRNGESKSLPQVLAAEDALLVAGSVHNVLVTGPFAGRTDWLVEKVVISTDDASVVAAPTTWINTDSPYLPIANPTTRPWYIRKGEVVGHLLDPETYADRPKDEAEMQKYTASADAIRTTIGTLCEQDLANASFEERVPHAEDLLEGDHNWGPKTTAVPEDPLPDVDMSTLVNWGPDIPVDVKPRLEEVLCKNAVAFGVGGRLGHVDTKVPIPLKPDTQPISMPMYGASPAKREVINKQMDAWFEAEVIEPSVSPWGFPCIVVYRNGKPRLCVDYRKLNERMVPDEFPIPRQSEILQALSGAQVLSSFDALAGFTQLEMADDAKEKMAFRSHRGLWQFWRMPFGLRNGPSVFQRVMQGVLAPFLWLFTLVYIDDIVVFSKSWEEHLGHLDKVLGAIASAGITLSP